MHQFRRLAFYIPRWPELWPEMEQPIVGLESLARPQVWMNFTSNGSPQIVELSAPPGTRTGDRIYYLPLLVDVFAVAALSLLSLHSFLKWLK